MRDLPRSPSGRPFFSTPISTEIAGAKLVSSSGNDLAVLDVVARSEDCQHLALLQGVCPRGPGSLLMSTRSADYLNLKLGTNVTLSVGGNTRQYKLSGLYSAGSASASYWWGNDLFSFGTALTPPPRLDAVFADPSLFSAPRAA